MKSRIIWITIFTLKELVYTFILFKIFFHITMEVMRARHLIFCIDLADIKFDVLTGLVIR